MPTRVRLDHDVMTDTGLHVITSPDIKGFCIVAETSEKAERDASDMLALIRAKEFGPFSREHLAVEREIVEK